MGEGSEDGTGSGIDTADGDNSTENEHGDHNMNSDCGQLFRGSRELTHLTRTSRRERFSKTKFLASPRPSRRTHCGLT